MDRKLKALTFALSDVLFITASWVISVALCGLDITETFPFTWYYFVGGLAVIMALNLWFGLYMNIWRYAGFPEALRIVIVSLCALLSNIVIASVSHELPLYWAFVCSSFIFCSLGVVRFIRKFVGYFGIGGPRKPGTPINVIILGAGEAGSAILREFKATDQVNMNPVCFLDDNPDKIGRNINGVKIVGKIDEVAKFAEKFNAKEVLIAIPSLSSKRKKEILAICQATSLKVKIIPGIYQFANGKLSVSSMREVNIQDLLGREQVKVNLDQIMGYIENKVIMVTGGGGSIGSELCRQIAAHNPAKLVILDIYENNAYDIQQELSRKNPDLNLDVIISSVRDKAKIDKIFSEIKPQIVFHAAAHKHVPLMERNPAEAVKNNVGGTYNVADAAGKFGAERFIMISTDKAVNPTNVMGATKRICEMIIQTMDKKYETVYAAVRFGNVLGSNGSVIPLFRKQIEDGGPVTVTHKEIVRYFMTIPEAVSLVLQAGAYAKDGEIFVLDMGEQVRIYDLAINMIKLSGLEPFKDIDIVITGLRPGEKLYEERLMTEEGLKKTANEMISIGKPLKFDEKKLFTDIEDLVSEAKKEESDIKEKVRELVPTYHIDYGTNH